MFTTSIDNCINEFNLSLSSRLCLIGESLQPNGEFLFFLKFRCIVCPISTFKQTVPYLSNELTWPCSPCDLETQVCLGSYNLRPSQGYWRSKNDSIDMITCYGGNIACNQGNISSDPLGNCGVGYKGILCSVCDSNYSSMGDFTCESCPANYWVNAIYLVIFFMIFMALIVFTIRTILKAKSTHLNICLRILINHIQALSVLNVFSVYWPAILQIFIKNIKNTVDIGSQLLSIDCFIRQSPSMSKYLLIKLLLLIM